VRKTGDKCLNLSMIKPSEEKMVDEKPLNTEKKASTLIQENTMSETVDYTTDSLMPELEELVKKNPNRLIGCGG
jgi:hypothetical protein